MLLTGLIYRIAEISGENPAQAIAESIGLKQRTATNWIRRARTAGYLTSTAHGKAARRVAKAIGPFWNAYLTEENADPRARHNITDEHVRARIERENAEMEKELAGSDPMGTIEPYETASGKRYRVRYRTPDHRQTDKRGFRTKRDADLFLATVEVSKATGEYIAPARARTTIAELGPGWLEAKRSRLKPSSYRAIDDAWRVYVMPRWGATPVSAITHSDVRTWVSQLAAGTAKTNRRDHIRTRGQGARTKSATVVIRAHGVLASVLDIAVKDRRIPNNPARGVDNLPRKIRKAHQYLTHEEIERLAVASGEYSTLVYVAAYTGLRWGELTALRVRDVDALRRRLAVNENAVRVGAEIHVGSPKTHEMRSVPYPQFLELPIAKLCEGKKRDGLLFGDGLDYFGRPRSSGASRSWLKSALDAAGLERMTIHDLRHTAASLAISSGANVKAVQRMLGHASAAMTLDVDADLFDDDLDTVSASLNEARNAAISF